MQSEKKGGIHINNIMATGHGHDRTRRPQEEDEDDDPVDAMINRTGCAKLHWEVQVQPKYDWSG